MTSPTPDARTTDTAAPPLSADRTPPVTVRASDADRAAVCSTLHEAAGAGLLSLDEAEERLGAACAARFLHELVPLTVDLPAAAVPVPDAGWSGVLAAFPAQIRRSLAVPADAGPARSALLRVRVLLLIVFVVMASMLLMRVLLHVDIG